MKVIKCELCGSNQFIKQDGVFVCQHCGTKYSAEEAKKMMIEGTVEVTGSVRIDNSGNLEKALKNARRAKDDNNSELAEKYYEEVRNIDPDNWEAVFFNTYFKSMQCKIAEIQSAAISINNCIDSTLNLIKDHVSDETEQEVAVNEVAIRVIEISNMLFNAAKNHYDDIDIQIRNNYVQEYVNNAFASFKTVYYLGDLLEIMFGDKKYACDLAVLAWKSGINSHNKIINLLDSKELNIKEKTIYEDKIKKYDTSYKAPDVPTNNGGCYVATAIYGSYDCPQVWTLRYYRDNVLAETWYGRIFIQIYYIISPTIVKWFGKTEWFNRIFRNLLDNFIEKLKNNQ